MRFITALVLLWITQLQAAPSLLEEAELQAARDPVGYLQRLDANPQQDMELFYARALAQAALGHYPQALLDNARARELASAQQQPLRLLDFQLQQVALILDTEAPDKALRLLARLKPAVIDHPMQASEWHALNGLALYRTQARQLLDSLLATLHLAPDYRAIILGYQAMALNAQGDWTAALRSLDEAQALYQQLGYQDAGERLLETRVKALQGRGEIQLALQLLTSQGHPSAGSKALQASLLAQQGRYPEAYEALSAYMNDYKQHFNQALSQHAATFQAEMDLARSEANNRVLQEENERKRQQLLHQQSARNYQLMLVGLLAGALLLLGITTHRLHRSSRHLYKLATFDQLTELPNRRALLERLAIQWQLEDPLTLLIIDIDHFKQINDRHGHQAGDRAIQRLARELSDWAPDAQLIGRWGGEEFLVAVPLAAEDCWHLAEQLRLRISQLDTPHMTISIGIAGRSEADEGLGPLIHRADMAMYQAKRQGRNQTILATTPSAQDELTSSVA